ncbi:MAG: hypothetical protein RLY16_1232 [Bacteroidota bacterium]
METNKRIVYFVVGATCIYLLISFIFIFTGYQSPVFDRVNLVKDLFNDSTRNNNTSDSSDGPALVIQNSSGSNFDLYQKGHLITNFNADTNQTSLQAFMGKLYQLKTGKKRKIRIGYFGDSMIEGDLMTQTLRKLLQGYFGGSGVGFVPIQSPSQGIRQTVSVSTSKNWDELNFKNAGKNNHLFFSGYQFNGNNSWVNMQNRVITDSAALIEKLLFYGNTQNEPANIQVNDRTISISGNQPFNVTTLDNSPGQSIKLTVNDTRIPIYGISFEAASGVIVDNFSFRGISGLEYGNIDSEFLKSIAASNLYDLIIFQYGVNILYKPNDIHFNWFANKLMPTMQHLRSYFPNSDFMIISTADRAFRYDGTYQSAIGIDSLIKIQATVAYKTNCSFYNLYATMGGKNSIVRWAQADPSLANKDYVHPNHRGAEVLAGYFFEALLHDYKKYTSHLKQPNK